MHSTIACLLLVFCFPVFLNAVPPDKGGGDSLMLGCGLGEGGGKDSDGRQWTPDNKYLSGGNSVTSKASFQDPSLFSEVPYMTSRVFTSEATYKFPVKPDKRYWLRLHFYPAVYNTFDPANSYFSVTSNAVTLLSNFSASITCQALSQAYLDREYSLAPLDSDTLTLTFKPSEKQNGAFAFVNGIQLIEIPELFDSAPLVGYSDQTMDTKSLHFQTMFRLNVGGQFISPKQDSGLSRMWYDDTPYLYGAATGVTNQATKDVKIDYKTMPQNIAPPNVYSTSRSMGNNKDVNMGFNLTWIFQVDPGSMYLTRLHFCDYFYSKVNEIVFKIFINNQTAEAEADVIGWTGGKGVPTYKDYVIYVKDEAGDDQLWLALHPALETKPEFYDSLLNGVEVFKLNDTDLSGPNPQPSEMLIQHEEHAKTFQNKHGSNKTFVIGSAAGGAAGFALVAAIPKHEPRSLCSRPALNPSLPKEQVSLAEWALYNKRRGTLEDIIDPNIKGQINPESLKKFADAAEKCVSDLGFERPSMNDLLWNLEFALNVQQNPNGTTHEPCLEESEFEDVNLEKNDMAAHYKNLSLGSEHDLSH
ncbi:Receptor-like protein kinase ANXUR1 [Glycine soja]|uniref:Receptor-like protein kinase ANXUR1 n=1 Tax=Glycine soja TaxID=3848 RepID=A0A0B2Q3Z3_GLYSO|nr:Receptor-like protein kinase ANXUR1 [Glycine soja]